MINDTFMCTKDYNSMSKFMMLECKYNHKKIRVLIDQMGNQWWNMPDVCEALGLFDFIETYNGLAEDEKMFMSSIDIRGEHTVLAVNDFGILTLIQQSGSPEANKFKQWVTYEILPYLYKTYNTEKIH